MQIWSMNQVMMEIADVHDWGTHPYATANEHLQCPVTPGSIQLAGKTFLQNENDPARAR